MNSFLFIERLFQVLCQSRKLETVSQLLDEQFSYEVVNNSLKDIAKSEIFK